MFPRRTLIRVTPSPDALIAAIAARQHGVITTGQLVGAGLGRSAISKRTARGPLHRRYMGVYAVGQPQLSQQGEWMAAILACGLDAYLASLNAAVQMKCWRRRVTGIHVPAPRERKLPGVRVPPRSAGHHAPRRHPGHRGAAHAGGPHGRAHAAPARERDPRVAFRNLFDVRAVRAAIQRSNGRHNLHVLHKALALNAAGSAGTRSELEDRFLALPGMPEPLVNTKVQDIEVDFHWPDRNLIVEVDGPGRTRPRTERDDAQLKAARDHEVGD